MITVKPKVPLLDSIADDPALLDNLDRESRTEVFARIFRVAGPVMMHFVSQALRDAQAHSSLRPTDRLLPIEETAQRLACSVTTLRRRWKMGQYPFIIKDGGMLVASEDGLERWIKARTSRKQQ